MFVFIVTYLPSQGEGSSTGPHQEELLHQRLSISAPSLTAPILPTACTPSTCDESTHKALR